MAELAPVIPIRSPAARPPAGTETRTLATAVTEYLSAHTSAGAWSAGTATKYRQTLTTLMKDSPLEHLPVGHLDDEVGRTALQDAYTTAFGGLAPATRARHLATLRSALAWWRDQGWLTGDPTSGWVRPKVTVDTTRALTRDQVAALWAADIPVRDKALARMLYETAARASEVLNLNIEDVDRANRRARVTGKGGDVGWIAWQTGTAGLLPKVIAGRTTGPVFLADRLPTRATAAADLCPATGRARLSYRRAAELFNAHTAPLTPDGTGWTLHQLRHSALTHDAEAGTNTAILLARSRHASVRSLERYARPGIDAVAAHLAATDPAARRR